MRRKAYLNLIVLLLCVPLWGQNSSPSVPPPISQPSLGEMARQLRSDRQKEVPKDVKVFTNDNIPHGGGGLSVVGPTEPAAAITSSPQGTGEPGPGGPPD